MPDEMTCFACEQEPTQQCPRCGRPYCDDHGEDVCDACLEPASGLPSFTLYRGSLLALLIGTALALYLILQPPGDSSDTALGPLLVTPTEPAVIQSTATPPPTDQTPASGQTPTAGQTPGAGTTPSASPTEPSGPSGTTTYTVQSGDTLFAVCAEVSSMDPLECVDEVLALNGITDPANIGVGQEILVPQ